MLTIMATQSAAGRQVSTMTRMNASHGNAANHAAGPLFGNQPKMMSAPAPSFGNGARLNVHA